jgi:hypothetical protein
MRSSGLRSSGSVRRVVPISKASSRYLMFDRAEWAALRANTPMSLTDPELAMLRWPTARRNCRYRRYLAASVRWRKSHFHPRRMMNPLDQCLLRGKSRHRRYLLADARPMMQSHGGRVLHTIAADLRGGRDFRWPSQHPQAQLLGVRHSGRLYRR